MKKFMYTKNQRVFYKKAQVKMTDGMEYSKLDRQIRNMVCKELKRNHQTSPYEIRVGVLNAVVHLAGEAPNLEIWELIQKITEQIPGVRGVVNRIESPGAPEPARTIHLHLKPPVLVDDNK
jgi:osmotically-inducible protein OsmY